MGNNSQPNSSIHLEVIIYPNQRFERIEGKSLMMNPHRSIVAITSKTDSGRPNFASGVLLSKNLLLTAAHAVYNLQQMSLNTKFKVYHEPQGIASDYHEVESFKYLPQFQRPKAQLQFDYSLIKLKDDQKLTISYSDFPKLLVTCKRCLDKKQLKIGIFGYPLDPERPYDQNYQPINAGGIRLFQYGFQLKNRVQLIQHRNFLIQYKINTKGGQSGCPIIMDDKIIGIHNGGDEKQQVNSGRLVTAEMAQNILQWSQQLNTDPIEILYNNQCCKIKEQDKSIQIKQRYMSKIVGRLNSIPVEEKRQITSLTLKLTYYLDHRDHVLMLLDNLDGLLGLIGGNELSDLLLQFIHLRNFTFYIRFPLRNWQSFQDFSAALNKMNLSKISIIVDPQHEPYEQENHWAKDLVKNVEYRKWNWN